jgi:hypothetical protein
VRQCARSIATAFTPNYRFERAERDRLKRAKKEEKLKRQEERTSSRQDVGSTEKVEEKDGPEA